MCQWFGGIHLHRFKECALHPRSACLYNGYIGRIRSAVLTSCKTNIFYSSKEPPPPDHRVQRVCHHVKLSAVPQDSTKSVSGKTCFLRRRLPSDWPSNCWRRYASHVGRRKCYEHAVGGFLTYGVTRGWNIQIGYMESLRK